MREIRIQKSMIFFFGGKILTSRIILSLEKIIIEKETVEENIFRTLNLIG